MELAKFDSEVKYSSRFLVEQINIFRKSEEDKSELAHYSFLTKIEKEFSDEIGEKNIFATSYTYVSFK
jgi:hypothetical protein